MKVKFSLSVTILVVLCGCGSSRIKLDETEKRVIPTSEFKTGEWKEWREDYEPPVKYRSASRDEFRRRVKTSASRSKKSVVTGAN